MNNVWNFKQHKKKVSRNPEEELASEVGAGQPEGDEPFPQGICANSDYCQNWTEL